MSVLNAVATAGGETYRANMHDFCIKRKRDGRVVRVEATPGEHAAAGRHRRRPRTLLLSVRRTLRPAMVHMPDDYPRLPQRRPALRSVPLHRALRAGAPAPVAVRPIAQPDDSLAETLRKLWRRKKMIAAVTILLGGAAAAHRLVDAVLLLRRGARAGRRAVAAGVQHRGDHHRRQSRRRAGAERRLSSCSRARSP